MNGLTPEQKKQGVEYLLLILLLLTVFTAIIAIGYIFGAGVGWLVFALLCLLVFWRVRKDYFKTHAPKDKADNG